MASREVLDWKRAVVAVTAIAVLLGGAACASSSEASFEVAEVATQTPLPAVPTPTPTVAPIPTLEPTVEPTPEPPAGLPEGVRLPPLSANEPFSWPESGMDQITDDKLAWALWQAIETLNLTQFIYGENFDEFHPDAPQWVHLRNFYTPEAAERQDELLRDAAAAGPSAALGWDSASKLAEVAVDLTQFGPDDAVLRVCIQGAAKDDPGSSRTFVLAFRFRYEDLVVPLMRKYAAERSVSETELVPCALN